MSAQRNLESIAAELLNVLQTHGLVPDAFGFHLTLPREDFEALAADYPRYNENIILSNGKINGIHWSAQINPRRRPQPLPPAGGATEAIPSKPHLSREEVERLLLKERRLSLRNADLHGLDLRQLNLFEIDLAGVDFQNADLREVNLEGANLMWANLQGADLRGANLDRADLWRANLAGVALDDTTRLDAKWHLVWDILNHAQLYKINLRGVDLSGAYFHHAYLFADLRGANLQQADLTSAALDFADLRGANLAYADLRGARLRTADLEGAILAHANLETADTSDANFTNADLTDAKLPPNWKKPTWP